MDKNNNEISLKDRVISKQIGELPEEILTDGSLVLGTMYGMKRKGMNFPKSIMRYGVPAGAAGMIVGSSLSNTLRLKRQHNKEFGTDPSKKDYAKILAVNAIPSAIGYGVFAKNKDEVEKTVGGLFESGKQIKNSGVGNFVKRKGADFASKLKPSAIKENITNIKNVKINPKTMKTLGGLALLTAAVEGPSFLVTPETIINKKKKEMNQMNSKTAYEIIDEAYEKVASMEFRKKVIEGAETNPEHPFSREKQKEYKRRAKELLFPMLASGAIGGTAGNVISRKFTDDIAKRNMATYLGIATGELGVVGAKRFPKLKEIYQQEFGENPKFKDYMKALTYEPEQVAHMKKIRDQMNSKTAYEIIDEAYEKVASRKFRKKLMEGAETNPEHPFSREKRKEYMRRRAKEALVPMLASGAIGGLAGNAISKKFTNNIAEQSLGAYLGALTGISGAMGASRFPRLKEVYQQEFKEDPKFKDYMKALTYEPEQVAHMKKIRDQMNSKTAYEIIDEAYEKVASIR